MVLQHKPLLLLLLLHTRTMMKLALLTTLLAGASAFAPAQVGKTATALNGAFDNEIGAASAELGCWDPLGYVADGDKKRFDHLRGVELKHGRIAMLATWGYATTWSGARFPGCEDFPAGHEVRNNMNMMMMESYGEYTYSDFHLTLIAFVMYRSITVRSQDGR